MKKQHRTKEDDNKAGKL